MTKDERSPEKKLGRGSVLFDFMLTLGGPDVLAEMLAENSALWTREGVSGALRAWVRDNLPRMKIAGAWECIQGRHGGYRDAVAPLGTPSRDGNPRSRFWRRAEVATRGCVASLYTGGGAVSSVSGAAMDGWQGYVGRRYLAAPGDWLPESTERNDFTGTLPEAMTLADTFLIEDGWVLLNENAHIPCPDCGAYGYVMPERDRYCEKCAGHGYILPSTPTG